MLLYIVPFVQPNSWYFINSKIIAKEFLLFNEIWNIFFFLLQHSFATPLQVNHTIIVMSWFDKKSWYDKFYTFLLFWIFFLCLYQCTYHISAWTENARPPKVKLEWCCYIAWKKEDRISYWHACIVQAQWGKGKSCFKEYIQKMSLKGN